MLAALSRERRTAGELGALFDAAQPTISRHLRVLEQAGLVARRVEGRRHVFTLGTSRLKQANAWIDRHLAFWDHSLRRLGELLDETEEDAGT